MTPTATTQTPRYRAQSAREAQEMGYGSETYWNYLEQAAQEHYVKGVKDAFTASLSDVLRGNDGD